jgi:acyl dehydratase
VTSSPQLSHLAQGAELPTRRFRIRRADLARYAAAAGDDNPIHLDDEAARAVGLPGVVAHGMLTMALAGRALSDWAGGPAAIVEYGVRFTKPVPVPDDDDGSELEVSGMVKEHFADGTARIDLRVTFGGQPVLGMARARVKTQDPSGQPS